MARPIEVTPVLRGKDAENVLRSTREVVPSQDRLRWLASMAETSKKVENNK